jgi:DNA-binding HxlR family transcriptional regulator
MDFQDACPKYEKATTILGKKWTGLILRSLLEGPRRFTQISSYVSGLSDNLLSKRLRELEKEGIIQRRVLDQRPIIVAYVVESIQRWADEWESAAVR